MDPRDLATVLVVAVAVLSTAIGYGTDVFAAWVLRPAVDRSADAAVVDVVGHLHVFGDVRMPVPGTVSLLTTRPASSSARHPRAASVPPSRSPPCSAGPPSTCGSAGR